MMNNIIFYPEIPYLYIYINKGIFQSILASSLIQQIQMDC